MVGEKDFMYWVVGLCESGKSWIVKIEIGGMDTFSVCISGCFKRVGIFEESYIIGGISVVLGECSVFVVSFVVSMMYIKYFMVIVLGIELIYISAFTFGTLIKIYGFGFYSFIFVSGMSYLILCRFGYIYDVNNGFLKIFWLLVIYVLVIEFLCMVLSALNLNFFIIGYSEV